MVQKEIVEKIRSPRFTVFVVWVPVMSSDSYQSAQQSQTIFPDGRVKHWWDNRLALGLSYRKILPLAAACDLAWDVYLLYHRGAQRFRYALGSDGKKGWIPPAPDLWMHQLSCMDTREQYFDAAFLREKIQTLLDENQAGQ